MIVADDMPGLFPDIFLGVQVRGSDRIFDDLQARVAWTPFHAATNGVIFNLHSIVGITAYNHNGASRDELIAQAGRALQLAEVEDSNKAYLMTDGLEGETLEV